MLSKTRDDDRRTACGRVHIRRDVKDVHQTRKNRRVAGDFSKPPLMLRAAFSAQILHCTFCGVPHRKMTYYNVAVVGIALPQVHSFIRWQVLILI